MNTSGKSQFLKLKPPVTPASLIFLAKISLNLMRISILSLVSKGIVKMCSLEDFMDSASFQKI